MEIENYDWILIKWLNYKWSLLLMVVNLKWGMMFFKIKSEWNSVNR